MKLLLLATTTYAAKQATQAPRAPGALTPVIPLTNLTQALGGYRPKQDYAVFFYSPYGEAGAYCQRVLPLWDAVAKWLVKPAMSSSCSSWHTPSTGALSEYASVPTL